MKKISIIIPVYNVEKYLSECIESVLNYRGIEIILVDDGSTDGSGKICDKYALKNKNITVIHQKNKGLSGARNSGIKKASGDYLMFVDSDDLLIPNINLGAITKEDTDIIVYKWKYFYEDSNLYKSFQDYDDYSELQYFDTINRMIQTGQISISACNKMVKKDLIVKNNLYFEEGLLSEDVDWSLRLYLAAKSISVKNQDIYIYRQNRSGSITTTKSKKTIDSLFYIIDKWYSYNYPNEKTKNTYYCYLAYWYLILLTAIRTKKDKKRASKYKDLLKYDSNYKVKKATKLIKVIGTQVTIYILRIYKKLHAKGKISI